MSLTQRELEVLQWLRKGLGTKAIAEKLFISIATVRNHIQAILTKLGVGTRLEAVALSHTIVSPSEADRLLHIAQEQQILLTPDTITAIRAAFPRECNHCCPLHCDATETA